VLSAIKGYLRVGLSPTIFVAKPWLGQLEFNDETPWVGVDRSDERFCPSRYVETGEEY
jgi:hypothetical protein